MSIEQGGPSWGVEHNPHGPWANIDDKHLQDAILRMAVKNHATYAATHSEYARLTTFLDACTSAWLEQKAHVEQEAQKHGFISCENTAALEESIRKQTALLCLTLKGSNILLGNGCLSAAGGFARYAKISVRQDEGCSVLQVSHGVRVTGEAALHHRLYFHGFCDGFNGIRDTSSLQLLFYTTNTLSNDHQSIIAAMLDESILRFNDTLFGMTDQTNSIGIPIPEEIHELV
jgi:hypothetical protein